MKSLLFAGLAASLFGFLGCAQTPVPEGVGLLADGGIPEPAPCPSSPNCVSSFVDPAADAQHGAEAIPREERSPAEAQARIREILASEPRTTIESDVPGYIHAVQLTATFQFPDDVEFWFPEDDPVIHFRSAARLGKSDLGVNRKRMDGIRDLYREG